MFKKSLAAVALLGAFAGSAFAADVTLYGVVDEGFLYTHKDADKTDVDAVDKLELKSGIQAGSRWGLKGTEDLGNGLKVGFILESGFNADDGTQSVSGTMFNREASLSVMGPFGQLSLGKIGAITQGTSSWGKVGAVSAFGTSYGAANVGNATNVFAATVGVMDNTIAYQTPKFAGFTVYAQYSMGNSKTGTSSTPTQTSSTPTQVENKSSTDRYYALGATYANGPVNLYFAVDSVNYASYFDNTTPPSTQDMDDSLTVAFGGSYDFSVVKVFAGAQYFDEVLVSKVSGLSNVGLDFLKSKMEGYALQASASAPLAGGTGYFGVGYVDASEADSVAASAGFDIKYYVASVGYKYDLSKRTNVYGVLSYAKGDQDVTTATATVYDRKPSMVGFGVGLRHNF